MDFPNRYIIDISYSFCRLLNDFSICVKKMADCWQRPRLPYWESLNMPTLGTPDWHRPATPESTRAANCGNCGHAETGEQRMAATSGNSAISSTTYTP